MSSSGRDRYFEGRLVDDDVSLATGLSERSLRELAKLGGVRPVEQPRGPRRVRLWSWDALRRYTVVAATHEAGYPLKIAHTMSFCHSELETVLAMVCPECLRANGVPDEEGWYAEDGIVRKSDRDSYLHIIDQRWIIGDFLIGYYNYTDSSYKTLSRMRPLLGEINSDRTVIRFPYDLSQFSSFKDEQGDVVYKPRWIGNRGETLADPNSLLWEYDPSLYQKWDDARFVIANPLNRLSLNLTLRLRIGIRRILGLPINYPEPTTGDASA